MKSYGKRVYISIFWLVLGAALVILEFIGKLDRFWSGMGAGLMAIAILQLIRYARYSRDSEYREKVDTAGKDERNRYISNKAWAWAGYIFVIASAVATVAFKVAGQDELSVACGCGVGIMVMLYWISYLILSRKY